MLVKYRHVEAFRAKGEEAWLSRQCCPSWHAHTSGNENYRAAIFLYASKERMLQQIFQDHVEIRIAAQLSFQGKSSEPKSDSWDRCFRCISPCRAPMALPSEEEVQDFLEERRLRLFERTRSPRIIDAPSNLQLLDTCVDPS